MSTFKKAQVLQQLADTLLYEDEEVEFFDTDRWQQLQATVTEGMRQLSTVKGTTAIEEGEICLALLMGCRATLHDASIRRLAMSRTYKVFPHLSPSLLKCYLFVYLYGELEDETMAREAHRIIDTWQDRQLTREEKKVTTILSIMEETSFFNIGN